jgi:hypothetical protein
MSRLLAPGTVTNIGCCSFAAAPAACGAGSGAVDARPQAVCAAQAALGTAPARRENDCLSPAYCTLPLPHIGRQDPLATSNHTAHAIRLQGVTYGRLREDSDTEAGNHSAEQNGATSDSGGGGHGDHDEFDFSEIAVHQVTALDCVTVSRQPSACSCTGKRSDADMTGKWHSTLSLFLSHCCR